MWCLMVGVVWVWNGWVDSDGWCHGGRRLLGHMMLTNGSGFCFEFYFIFLDLFEVWCKWIYLRWDVGWLIGWADLCLIALCDTRSNWVDLGLMEGGFLFLECNVNFYFSKWECMAWIWECMVLIWKMGTSLVIFFSVIFLKIHVLCISFGLVWAFREKHLCYGVKKKVNREHGKKSFGESNDNTRCLIFRSKLVVFNNCWTCLVFSQTSREVYGIYPNQ